MRRTPYIENNERLALKYATQLRAQQERKTADLKIYQPELDALARNQKTPSVMGQQESNAASRVSPLARRPSTSKNGILETTSTSKPKDLKNYMDRKASELDYRTDALTPANMRYHLPAKRSTNKSDLYVPSARESKEQIGARNKIYRSFRESDVKQSFSYQRREMTPSPTPRYEKDKPKTPRGYSNPRTSRQKEQRKPLELSLSRPIELLAERKQRKLSKQNAQPQFYQYVLRFSYRTKKGFMPNNPGKCNQDSFIVTPNIGKKSWQHYFGVCDGHGVFGHQVSGFIKNQLPAIISRARGIEKNPQEALTKSFAAAMEKLVVESKIDLTFSGSTVVGCYLSQEKLYCCNVGDSRAIMGSYDQKTKKWTAKPLCEDHKPTIKEEAERIAKCGGRVQSFKDPEGNPIGPLRVWLKQENVPGLAMTRSFGDLVAASVGVSSVPEVFEFTMNHNDRIMIIGSDGVWQFLSNEQVLSIVSPFYEQKKIEEACDVLLDRAVNSWTRECSVIDDITFIMLFLSYSDVN